MNMNLMDSSSSLFINNPFSLVATALAVLLLTLLILKITLFSSSTSSERKKSENKKKKYHPIAGTIFNQLLNFKRLHHYMTDLAREHKTYRLLSPFRSEVYTSDPANVEYILKTNFQNYGKGWHNYYILSDLLGDGIFTVDGEKWRHQRKVSSYEFSTKVLRDFSSAVFRRNAAKLARIISDDYAKSNRTLDAQDLLMKSTLDSIFKVGFGVELNSICGGSNDGTRFANAFNDSSAMTLWRYVDIFWVIKRFLNVGFEAKLKKNIKVVDDFIYKVIQSKIEQASNPQDDSSSMMKKEDILSRFLELKDTDPRYLRDITLNFLVAGRDTTATTLSWFLYMLCKNPHTQEKIAKEVREATEAKDDTPFDKYVESVTDEALDKMHYLHAALAETLRLYPAVPVDAKICFSDDTLPDGYSVRKGDMVAYQPYAMGRMKYIWGEDAEEFRPERWIDQDGFFRGESSFKFTAFQAGPRICLGKEFAYRQMKIFAAILLGCFSFKLADESKPVNYRTMLNLHIDDGLYLQASHRSLIIN
ncbi:Cytochrome P450 [Macleaya cordata]|uniref:Cytochrome P450 n=1 Tax=Macleaya cordata TaxID=56857 RepID=A0A200RE10_MACCD|nr:Cytochrome P450 [Macleaya cordata]